MIGPLTYLDAALLAVALLSGLLAMYRGFARELLSILSWLIAAGVVAYFVWTQRPFASEVAQTMNLPNPNIALIGIGAVLFVIVLVVVHLITSHISDSIQDSRVGMIDRVLGFMFGAVRGFVLVVIPYMFYAHFVPEPQHYAWVRNSKSLPYIKSTGETFRTLLERYTPAPLISPPGSDQQQG